VNAVPPSVPTKIKPSGAWYVLVVVLLAASGISLVVGLFLGVVRVSDRAENFYRFEAPTAADGEPIEVSKPGTYVVYYEEPSENQTGDLVSPPMTVAVTAADGTPVPVEEAEGEFSFDVDFDSGEGRAGVGVATFDAPAAGGYVVVIDSDEGPFEVAIGESLSGVFLATMALTAAIAGALFLIALVLWIVLLRKRGKAKRARAAALADAAAAPAWATWGGGPASGPYQPQWGTAAPPAGAPVGAPPQPQQPWAPAPQPQPQQPWAPAPQPQQPAPGAPPPPPPGPGHSPLPPPPPPGRP
jgi:hypothetical protein